MNNYLYMKTLKKFALIAVLLTMAVACKKDKESIDTEKPTIAIDTYTAFPKQCSTIKRGTNFTFRSTLSDNIALGSYTIIRIAQKLASVRPKPSKSPSSPLFWLRLSISQGNRNSIMPNYRSMYRPISTRVTIIL